MSFFDDIKSQISVAAPKVLAAGVDSVTNRYLGTGSLNAPAATPTRSNVPVQNGVRQPVAAATVEPSPTVGAGGMSTVTVVALVLGAIVTAVIVYKVVK